MPVHPNDHVADLQPRVRGWTVELDTSNERTAPRLNTFDGPRADALSSTPRWPDDARPALQFSAQDILDSGVLQRELGIHPLSFTFSASSSLQPLELGDARARVTSTASRNTWRD